MIPWIQGLQSAMISKKSPEAAQTPLPTSQISRKCWKRGSRRRKPRWKALQEELKETAKRRKRRDELGLQIPGTEIKIGQTEAALQELKAAGASLTARQEAAEKQRDVLQEKLAYPDKSEAEAVIRNLVKEQKALTDDIAGAEEACHESEENSGGAGGNDRRGAKTAGGAR